MEQAEGNPKTLNMQYVIDGLSALLGVVPELKQIELHPDVLHSGGSYDMVLICTFDSMEAMLAYQNHPAHLEMKKFIHKVITERATVDYIID